MKDLQHIDIYDIYSFPIVFYSFCPYRFLSENTRLSQKVSSCPQGRSNGSNETPGLFGMSSGWVQCALTRSRRPDPEVPWGFCFGKDLVKQCKTSMVESPTSHNSSYYILYIIDIYRFYIIYIYVYIHIIYIYIHMYHLVILGYPQFWVKSAPHVLQAPQILKVIYCAGHGAIRGASLLRFVKWYLERRWSMMEDVVRSEESLAALFDLFDPDPAGCSTFFQDGGRRRLRCQRQRTARKSHVPALQIVQLHMWGVPKS